MANSSDVYRVWTLTLPETMATTPSVSTAGGTASPTDAGSSASTVVIAQNFGNNNTSQYVTSVTAIADL